MIDNELLIREIYLRKPLWDTANGEPQLRTHIRKLWNEVANTVNSDYDSVKKRWKSLKDNYRVELKKVLRKSKLENGSNATSSKKATKWALFEHMEFLRNIMMHSVITKEENVDEEIPSVVDHDLNSQLTGKVSNENIKLEYFEAEDNEVVNVNEHFTNNNSREAIKRKINLSENDNNVILEIEQDKYKIKVMKTDSELIKDDNYNFLMSLLPHMRSMPELSNLKFRLQMSKLLLDMKDVDSK